MWGLPDLPLNPAVAGWVGIIGFALAIIFGIHDVVANRRNKKEKEPYWAVQSFALVRHSEAVVSDLDVFYRKRPIETLTVSEVLFWNAGRETINGSDAAAANPLRIVPHTSTEILDATIVATNSQSQPSIVDTPSGAIIKFDYVDRGQGILFRIVHTGSGDQDPILTGDVRGAVPLRRLRYFYRNLFQPPKAPPTLRDRLQTAREYWIVIVIALAAIGFYGFLAINASNRGLAVISFLVVLLGMTGAIWAPKIFSRREPLQPVGFKPFEEFQESLREAPSPVSVSK